MSMDGDMGDRLRRFLRDSEDGARRGIEIAARAVLDDCINELPTVPKDEGTLRGSGSVHVNGQPVATSADLGEMATGATPVTGVISQEAAENALEAIIGFNTPYAAYQHEGIRRSGTHRVRQYTEPSAGRKFLETALMMNPDRYFQIVNEETARYLKERGW